MRTRRVDLLDAEALSPGSIAAVTVDDLDLVVWRTESGRLCLMDARCPHQWSHLEAEGVVAGEEIVCAAHFWRFDPDGVGVKVAMNGRRDRKADIGVYPVEEVDGRLLGDLPG